MSPTAATRSLCGLALILSSHDVRTSEVCNVDSVVRYGKHSSAANFHFRRRQLELMLQPREQFLHEPARNLFPFGRVDESEVQQVCQQHFPVLLHRREQSFPADLLMPQQYEM